MKTPKEQHIKTMTGIPIEVWEKNNKELSRVMGTTPIKLNTNESNLIWAAKHWFAPKGKSETPVTERMRHENWWKVIGTVYQRVYRQEPNLRGIYYFVQQTWMDICPKLFNFERLFDELLNDTFPSNCWKLTGAPKVGSGLFNHGAAYSDKQTMMARIAAMMSQLSLLSKDEIALAPRWTDLDVDSVDISDILA